MYNNDGLKEAIIESAIAPPQTIETKAEPSQNIEEKQPNIIVLDTQKSNSNAQKQTMRVFQKARKIFSKSVELIKFLLTGKNNACKILVI